MTVLLNIPHERHGITLIELLVALAILGILAAVATLSIRAAEPPPDGPRQMLADSARVAAREARVVRLSLIIDGRRARAALAPDGSVVADSAFGTDTVTGASPHDLRE